jgi:RNA polymerase sigma-70 factor (ECF subfamily)
VTYHFSISFANTNKAPAEPPARPASLTDDERNAMLCSIPTLRRFAKSLTRDADRAEDLVQDTLLRGIANIHSFTPGTNIAAWLMVILRNSFLSQLRARRKENAYKASQHDEPIAFRAPQFDAVLFRELREALTRVPLDQRKALLLVFGYGYTYAEAATMCDCPAGTIKSRANRAHVRLRELMQADPAAEFNPDKNQIAAVGAALDEPATTKALT